MGREGEGDLAVRLGDTTNKREYRQATGDRQGKQEGRRVKGSTGLKGRGGVSTGTTYKED